MNLVLRLFDHAAGLCVAILDVLLKHLFLDAPLSPPSYLYGLQFAASSQSIGLRRIDLELFGDIRKSQESGHGFILPPLSAFGVVIHSFGLFTANGFGAVEDAGKNEEAGAIRRAVLKVGEQENGSE